MKKDFTATERSHKKYRKSNMTFTATMILGVICAIILFAFAGFTLQKIDLDEAIKVCTLSVIAQTGTKFKVAGIIETDSPLSLDCKTRFIDFYNNKVEIGLDPEDKSAMKVFYNGQDTKSFTRLNDYIVNQVIADEMRICFEQFGEGKMDVFNPQYWGEDDVCFICSDITFKADAKHNNVPYKGFTDYIKNTDTGKSRMTYWNYFDMPSLSPINWSLSIRGFYRDLNIEFDPALTYQVIFVKEYTNYAARYICRNPPNEAVKADCQKLGFQYHGLTLINFLYSPKVGPSQHVYVLKTTDISKTCKVPVGSI